jgi:hypothetical protein
VTRLNSRNVVEAVDRNGGGHPERLEHALAKVDVERRSTHDFHQTRRDPIVGVVVTPPLARTERQGGRTKSTDGFLERRGHGRDALLPKRHVGHATAVRQEVTNGDLRVPWIREGEVFHVVTNGGVERDAALLHELHHRQGGERLA